MIEPTQISLLAWQATKARENASPGIKRAAAAGSRVDAAVLAVAREVVGRDLTEGDFWALVTARVSCVPDTARRRRDALRDEGHLSYERPALGVIRVTWVRP